MPYRRRPRRDAATAILLLAFASAACSGNANGITLEVPSAGPSQLDQTTAASPSPPKAEVEADVKAQFVAYFRELETLGDRTPEERSASFRDVAVDPVYTRALKTVSDLDIKGQAAYGTAALESVVVQSISAGTATVRFCADGSTSGLKDKGTGEELTVGTDGAVGTAVLVRGKDSVWRVSDYAELPEEQC